MANPILKFVSSVCVQTAVYWGNPQPDGFGGITYDDPVEIKCRWDGKVQLVRNDNGEEVVSEATVLVTRDLDVNGMLYLGTLNDIDSGDQGSPEQVIGTRTIISKQTTPLFQSSTEFVREVFV
jgi:hypothetical protein